MKITITTILTFIGLTALFTVLTILHGLMPIKWISDNMKKSLQILDNEGVYPNIGKIIGHTEFNGFPGQGNTIDNFTNMWMVQSMDGEHYFDHFEYTQGTHYNPDIRKYIEGGKLYQAFDSGWENGNYWSGYRVFLKPLMTIFDIWGVRILILLLIASSMILAFLRIKQDIGFAEAVLLIISILAINPINTFLDLDQAPDLIQALLSSVTILWFLRKRINKKWFITYFMALGMIEIFVNCLIMPLVTLGIPLATYTLYSYKQKNITAKQNILDIIKFSFGWGVGYVGTFLSSWVISAIFKHASCWNAIKVGFGMFVWRAGANDDSLINNIYLSIHNNIDLNMPFIWLILSILTVLIFKYKNNRKIVQEANSLFPLVSVGVIPFLWIIALSNHSKEHAWMVHDIFMITIWVWLCVIYYLILIKTKNE
jgi:hypothetical protein